MRRALADKFPQLLRGRLVLLVVALIGLTASLSLAHYIRRSEQRSVLLEFNDRINLRHTLLREGLRDYTGALRSFRLLLENSESLTLAEFTNAAEEISRNTPGIQAINWVPVVSHDALPSFLEAARATITPDFTIRQRTPDGRVAPFSPRSEYAVITYSYPFAQNLPALGYDTLTALTAPDTALARSTDELILTRRFPLVQGQDGIVFLCTVRRPSTVPAPEGGRGLAQIVLRLEPMITRIWSQSPNPAADVMLLDVTPSSSPPTHLYTHLAGSLSPLPEPVDIDAFIRTSLRYEDITLGARVWRAYFRPRDAWLASRASLTPLLALFGGLLLTGVTIAYFRTLQKQTALIRREVAQRTAELVTSRATLEAIVDNHQGAIWVKDLAGAYLVANSTFCEFYGQPRSAILGRTAAELSPPAPVRILEAAETSSAATSRRFEADCVHAGETHTCVVHQFPLRSPDGALFATVGITTDITASRRAELSHRAIERKLLEAQKLESLGVLAGGIAHDFNNLLTGILGHASLARLQLPSGAPLQNSLAQIERSSQRAAELCQQMLAYSGQGRVHLQSAELGALVRDTVPLLNLSLAKNARLHFDLAPDLPLVFADVTQLRQIVMNLVMNASESLGDAPGDITLRTRPQSLTSADFALCLNAPDLPPGDYVCMEVTDTGCGMSPAVLARIFEPFFTTKFVGRGLGLAAVLGIVRGHRGALRVESAPGVGTTFRLYLPPAPASSPPPPEPASQAPFIPGPPAVGRLLLVDDEPSVRATASALLSSLGYAVDLAVDGDDGLRVFLAHPAAYRAAILDLTMPGLGGVELLRALRKTRPDLPVLLISGYGGRLGEEVIAGTPGVGFLAKPFTLKALRAKLDQLLPA